MMTFYIELQRQRNLGLRLKTRYSCFEYDRGVFSSTVISRADHTFPVNKCHIDTMLSLVRVGKLVYIRCDNQHWITFVKLLVEVRYNSLTQGAKVYRETGYRLA